MNATGAQGTDGHFEQRRPGSVKNRTCLAVSTFFFLLQAVDCDTHRKTLAIAYTNDPELVGAEIANATNAINGTETLQEKGKPRNDGVEGRRLETRGFLYELVGLTLSSLSNSTLDSTLLIQGASAETDKGSHTKLRHTEPILREMSTQGENLLATANNTDSKG